MKNAILTTITFFMVQSPFQTLAQDASTTTVTGAVEHVEAIENEATVKVAGRSKLLFLKNLTQIPESKLQAVMDSQESQKPVTFKVNEQNQIVDIVP